MPSKRAIWIFGATASLLLLFSGTALAQAQSATRIGIFYPKPNTIALGRALGVRYMRLILALDGGNPAQLERIRAAEAAGFRLNVEFNNITEREGYRTKSGPVANDASFEAVLSADLDATHPDLVTIQNEEDGLGFWSGTPADYLHELADAVPVAHAKGYRISNGGLTATGVKLAYWHHLWTSGQRQAADRFAAAALTAATTQDHVMQGDLPDSADPGRPILARNALMRAKLSRVEALIAGYPRTGVDYVNFHWYGGGPEELRDVATWLGETTGRVAICNEMGQISADPETVTTLLSALVSLHVPYVFWFAPDGRGAAVGLADDTGVLRANGAAFRAFVAAHQ